jgi:AraC-like DNA-binding protein
MTYLKDGLSREARTLLEREPSARKVRIAAACGVSVRTLDRGLWEAGVTFTELRDNVRFRRAVTFLVGRPLASIKEAAFEVEFSSQKAFTRWFTGRAGMSPCVFRQQHARQAGSEVRLERSGGGVVLVRGPQEGREAGFHFGRGTAAVKVTDDPL